MPLTDIELLNIDKKFKLAVSFAGEDREYVNRFAEAMSQFIPQESIFYDDNYVSDLLGEKIMEKLKSIYLNADIVIIFESLNYTKKKWTNFESAVLKERLFLSNQIANIIVPIKLDAASIDILPSYFGIIDGTKYSPEEAASIINKRLQSDIDFEKFLSYHRISSFDSCFSFLYNDLKKCAALKYDVSDMSSKCDGKKLFVFNFKKSDCTMEFKMKLNPLGIDGIGIYYQFINCTRYKSRDIDYPVKYIIGYRDNAWELIDCMKTYSIRKIDSYRVLLQTIFNEIILKNVGNSCECLY